MAPFCIHHVRPKMLFVFSTFLTAVAMSLIGSLIFLQEFYPNLPYLESFTWIPIVMLVVHVIMRSVGILPVLILLLSEIFPTEIRSQSVGLTLASENASGAIAMKLFPQMKNYMSLHGLFFLYGAVGVATCLWGLKTIPDNRGKSLIKVEEMYEKKCDEDKPAKKIDVEKNVKK